jgi:hypothetical protein
MKTHQALSLLLGFLLTTACADPGSPPPAAEVSTPSFRAASEWQEFQVEQDWVLYNPCLAEDLHGIGTIPVRGHWVTTSQETRQFLFDHVNVGDFHLEGLTTGQIWLPRPGNLDVQLSTASGEFFMWNERFVYVNQTTGVTLDWPLMITVVVNANGEVKVYRVQDQACRLR